MQGRVLVADDSSDGRKTIAGILECMDLDVVVAENGHVVCELALSASKDGRPFDLIFMDADMPEITGYEATALLRSVGYRGRIIALAPWL